MFEGIQNWTCLFYPLVQFSRSVVSSSLQPHGLQQANLPCPSPIPELTQTHAHRVSDAIQQFYPLSSHSSHLQSFPASGSFLMSQLFTSGGQSIGPSALALASVLPLSIQDWFSLRIDCFDLLAVQGTFKSLLQHHSSNASPSVLILLYALGASHPHMTNGKTVPLAIRLCWQTDVSAP